MDNEKAKAKARAIAEIEFLYEWADAEDALNNDETTERLERKYD